MPAEAGLFFRERAGSSLRRSRSDFGFDHSLRSETPWLFVPPPANGHPRDSPYGRFPAYGLSPSPCCRTPSSANGRLWRFVVRARPFAMIAPRRRLGSRHRRPCRASTCADSFLRSWPVACTPLPHLRDEPARSKRWELVSGAAPSAFWIRSDAAGLAVFALVAPLTDLLLAKPHPDSCPPH